MEEVEVLCWRLSHMLVFFGDAGAEEVMFTCRFEEDISRERLNKIVTGAWRGGLLLDCFGGDRQWRRDVRSKL